MTETDFNRKDQQKKMAMTSGNLLSSQTSINQKLIKGRYKLEKIIGRGLSGVVYKAKDVLSNRFAAIKIIEPDNVEY